MSYPKAIIKNFSAKTGILERSLFLRYHYMFTPGQLRCLLNLVHETRSVEGCYAEIGCAYGATTVLLKKYIDELGLERPYFAFDTFSGFVEDHANYDIDQLERDPDLKGDFSENSESWFHATLRANEVSGVEVVKGDASLFDFSKISPIAFSLLDVDLYKPISMILPGLYAALSPGGVIVVDDCCPNPKWEGAFIAYKEFMMARGEAPEVAAGKLGIIRKPAR